jgi:uncharacterized protein (TIGR02646 family)
MEKINKLPINKYPKLHVLAANWQTWGQEYKTFLDTKKASGVGFSWRQNIYEPLRNELRLLTNWHCSFCDGYPIGETSKETIEHYFPKNDYPLQAYEWENLFYCCDKCQSEANKSPFKPTLKPDEASYLFDDYFYFDLGTGELKVLENLENDEPHKFQNARNFLNRYGINNPIRNQSRKDVFQNIKNHLQNEDDERIRNDFNYRYIYDYTVSLLALKA